MMTGARSERALERWLARPRSILLWTLALVLAGAWSASRIELEWIPSVELPRIHVSALWPGASPAAVEREIVTPIERALRGLHGTASITSYALRGRAFLSLEVADDRNLDLYAAELSGRLSLLRETLPQHVTPRLTRQVPEALRLERSFMTLQLVGPFPAEEVGRQADRLAAALASLEGVREVQIQGGQERELRITIDSDKLRAHGLEAGMIEARLRQVLRPRSLGVLEADGQALTLVRPSKESLEGLRHLVLSLGEKQETVRLEDIARVELKAAPARSVSRIDGHPVVVLVLEREPGSHLLATAGRVRRQVESLQERLPEGLELLVAEDTSLAVSAELRDLAIRGGSGLLMVSGVLILLLRGPRPAALVLLSVVVSLAAALGWMQPLGLSLNLLTLAGLVLVAGLLVDNSLVVLEEIAAEGSRNPGASPASITRRALARVWLPLLGGTLTTAAVLVPLAHLSGELRALFVPFGVLVTVTLLISLLTAALLLPVLARFLPNRRPSAMPRRLRRLALAPYALAGTFPGLALLAVAASIGLPTPLLPESMLEPIGGWKHPGEQVMAERFNATLGSDVALDLRQRLEPWLGGLLRPFLTEVELGRQWAFTEEPELLLRLGLPEGSGIERCDELLRPFERAVLAFPAVERSFATVEGDRARLRVRLREESLAGEEPAQVRQALVRQALQLAGVEISITGLVPVGFHSGRGNVKEMIVEAFGPGYAELEGVAERFSRLIAEDPRVADVDIHGDRLGSLLARTSYQIRWGADAVRRTGRGVSELTTALRPQLLSLTPSFQTAFGEEPRLGVRILFEGAGERDLDGLLQLPLTAGDTPLRLAGTGTLRELPQAAAIERLDQRYKRYIRVFYLGPAELGIEMLEESLAGFPLPPGYRLELPSPALFDSEARRSFFWLLVGTLGIIFLILAIVFESWRLPALVLVSVPAGFPGLAAAFLASGSPFAEGAFLGSILLLGIVVNDSILLVHRYRYLTRKRPDGDTRRLALLALSQRLKPMWTTTTTTVVGMVPLLLAAEGSDFWKGLALAVVGGLTASTLLTPAVTIALLSLFRPALRQARAEAIPRPTALGEACP